MPLSRRRTAPRGGGFHRPCGTRTEAKDTHGQSETLFLVALGSHIGPVACNSRALPPCVNYFYENSRPCSHHPHLPSSSPICLHRFIFMMSHIPSSLSSKIYRAWFVINLMDDISTFSPKSWKNSFPTPRCRIPLLRRGADVGRCWWAPRSS